MKVAGRVSDPKNTIVNVSGAVRRTCSVVPVTPVTDKKFSDNGRFNICAVDVSIAEC